MSTPLIQAYDAVLAELAEDDIDRSTWQAARAQAVQEEELRVRSVVANAQLSAEQRKEEKEFEVTMTVLEMHGLPTRRLRDHYWQGILSGDDIREAVRAWCKAPKSVRMDVAKHFLNSALRRQVFF